jgi:hypothetical protein
MERERKQKATEVLKMERKERKFRWIEIQDFAVYKDGKKAVVSLYTDDAGNAHNVPMQFDHPEGVVTPANPDETLEFTPGSASGYQTVSAPSGVKLVVIE